jgi:ABC-type branched-subunit amino acid transport system substrate-binding protein
VNACAAASVVFILLLSAGCGSSAKRPVTIGVLTDCSGGFGLYREGDLAGAELPFLQRGATLRARRPSGGVAGAEVAGRPVRLVFACESYGSFASTIAGLRDLVEVEHADAVVGSLYAGDGLVLRRYAAATPGVVFVSPDTLPGTTLRHSASNIFRFNPDAAQLSGGLAAFLYRALGWRTVVTVGEDDPFGWAQLSGFIAEFCSLGGRVVSRVWAPGNVRDFRPFLAKVRLRGVDGVYFPGGLQSTDDLVTTLAARGWDTHRRLAVGDVPLLSLDPRLRGAVGVSSFGFFASPSWRRYAADFDRRFRGVQEVGYFDAPYYVTVEALVGALERVGGDLSDLARFRRALADIRLQAPYGPVRLDPKRQAVTSTTLARLVRAADGRLRVRKLREVAGIEQTFGGLLAPRSPPASRTSPACRRATPPSWAR